VNAPDKQPIPPVDNERRRVLRMLGKGSVVAAFAAQFGAAARAFFPNVLYEPPARFKLKRPDEYPPGFTFDASHRLFVVSEHDAFHVISAVCPHLGCTVQWRETEFDCPCHGSRFRPDGSVLSGPAPRGLSWLDTGISPDGSLEVDSAVDVASGFRFVPPKRPG
jgi:cytochrome b6-f complex iron-sulfur subunit